jgi:hypothetical protein
MAYFECVIGGGGTSLTIQITTTDTTLYGQTITLSKSGSTVGTTTFDNTGYAEYTVREAGQYTVTCQGYSAIVDVSNEFPVEIITERTITVTIYSAASDTVSFTDATGAKTATTDTSGAAANVSITFSPLNPSITFTSSVAKNPSNLSAYYSKTVTLTDNMTEVYVMPDASLYWWGYKSVTFTTNTYLGKVFEPTWTINSPSTCTPSTNSLTVTATRTQSGGVGLGGIVSTSVNVSNKTKLKVYVSSSSGLETWQNNPIGFTVNENTEAVVEHWFFDNQGVSSGVVEADISSINGLYMFALAMRTNVNIMATVVINFIFIE